jgi:hypothetical protein
MLVCREAARLITESYQRPLRWRERIALRMHLTLCDACTNFKKQMRLLTDAAQRLALQERVFSELQLADDARRRIRELMAAQRPDKEDS